MSSDLWPSARCAGRQASPCTRTGNPPPRWRRPGCPSTGRWPCGRTAGARYRIPPWRERERERSGERAWLASRGQPQRQEPLRPPCQPGRGTRWRPSSARGMPCVWVWATGEAEKGPLGARGTVDLGIVDLGVRDGGPRGMGARSGTASSPQVFRCWRPVSCEVCCAPVTCGVSVCLLFLHTGQQRSYVRS